MNGAGGETDRDRVRDLVRRHGWNATSFQVLEPGYRYFFPDAEACVAYVDTGGAWVAAGAPLAEPERVAGVAMAFVRAARARSRRACFFATEQRFVDVVPLRSLLVGEQAVWDPATWEQTLRAGRSLREQLRRARAKGVTVRALDRPLAPSPRTKSIVGAGQEGSTSVVRLVERWQRTRELAPMSFLAQFDPLALQPDHRLFVAERAGALVGLLVVAPVWGREGWLVQNLLRTPEAPNGTAEALVDQAMRTAHAEGQIYVTLGLAPLAGSVPLPLRLARRAGRVLYDFEGLRAFKAKLRPGRWDPVFVSYPPQLGAARVIVDVLAAFARGGLWRFGLRTLARGPALAVRTLAVLLVPWTLLLASADSARWFPRPWIKWAWVIFDVLVAGGLAGLQRRWRGWLARALTLAIGLDTALTTAEAASWNLPRAHDTSTALVLLAAVTAPAMACFLVGRATARHAHQDHAP